MLRLSSITFERIRGVAEFLKVCFKVVTFLGRRDLLVNFHYTFLLIIYIFVSLPNNKYYHSLIVFAINGS